MPSMSGGVLRQAAEHRVPSPPSWVSMPSMSGGVLRRSTSKRSTSSPLGFYALDVGRGFATSFPWVRCTRVWGSGLYALDVGRGFATRHERQDRPVHLH